MVVFSARLCHNPARSPPGVLKGCRGGIERQSARFVRASEAGFAAAPAAQGEQNAQIKTKSGAKKRFKVTGSGKVLSAMAGKRHGMIKRTNKQIRDHRGTRVLYKTDGDNIRKYFLPNG